MPNLLKDFDISKTIPDPAKGMLQAERANYMRGLAQRYQGQEQRAQAEEQRKGAFRKSVSEYWAGEGLPAEDSDRMGLVAEMMGLDPDATMKILEYSKNQPLNELTRENKVLEFMAKRLPTVRWDAQGTDWQAFKQLIKGRPFFVKPEVVDKWPDKFKSKKEQDKFFDQLGEAFADRKKSYQAIGPGQEIWESGGIGGPKKVAETAKNPMRKREPAVEGDEIVTYETDSQGKRIRELSRGPRWQKGKPEMTRSQAMRRRSEIRTSMSQIKKQKATLEKTDSMTQALQTMIAMNPELVPEGMRDLPIGSKIPKDLKEELYGAWDREKTTLQEEMDDLEERFISGPAAGSTLTKEELDESESLYDDEMARALNLRPDASGHGPSRVPSGPHQGLILKSENHPTFYKTVEADLELGGKFYRHKKSGRLYSFPGTKKVGKDFEEVPADELLYSHPGEYEGLGMSIGGPEQAELETPTQVSTPTPGLGANKRFTYDPNRGFVAK